MTHPTGSPTQQNKPIWLTEELSQEWIQCSAKQQQDSKQNNKPCSLRIPSNCSSNSRIPIPTTHSNSHSHSHSNSVMSQSKSNSNSILNLLQPEPSLPRLPSPNPSHSHSNSPKPDSDPSIVVNNEEAQNHQPHQPHHTPPWLKAAVDGMVNQVLGKRPTQLEKLFQQQPPPTTNTTTNSNSLQDDRLHPPHSQSYLISTRSHKSHALLLIPCLHPAMATAATAATATATAAALRDSSQRVLSGGSIHPSPAEQSHYSFLPNIQFQFSLPHSHTQFISFEESKNQQHSIQTDHSLPSQSMIVHQQGEEEEEEEEEEQRLERGCLSAPIPQGDYLERIGFNLDSRLDQIIEVTEPSSSIRISRKSNQSRNSSSNFGSLPSSFNPPSLPFAHRTPVLDIHGRIHRIKSDNQLSIQHNSHSPTTNNLPTHPSQIPSCDQSDLSTSQTRFRFTYDTFTRKHLNRLTEEIHGLSLSDASLPRSGGGVPLKIKSILGSPGEEVTDSTTSMGLAHSTPPIIMNTSSKHQPHIFHAGRTPFRPTTNLSQRLREETRWSESFIEPSSYAINSLSPVVVRKTQPDLQEPRDELNTLHDLNQLETQTGPHSCRSSKRIRLESPQRSTQKTRRRLGDSVTLLNERSQGRRTPGSVSRVHPMVVFKASVDTATTSHTPRGKPLAPHPVVVRDRLAEAKALMDRIRAKNTTDQEAPAAAQDSHPIGSLDNEACVSNPPAQIDPRSLEDCNSFSGRTAGHVQKHPEPILEWDISIDEGAPDIRDREERDEEEEEEEEEREGAQDSVHQRLASTAAAFLRQTLGDANTHHQNRHERSNQQYGSSTASTLTNPAGTTTASRRQFATQPVFREPIGRLTHDTGCNQLTHSSSTVACTTVSAPTPALTTATSTRHSSTSSHRYHLEAAADHGKQLHTQKLGLMTIAPGDVEELLQNRRVGNMVFDSTIGKWVKVRSQSETGGMLATKTETNNVDLEAMGEADIQHEESTDEEDIFKDIESLNSKRESNSSSSGLMAAIEGNTQTNFLEESQNDGDSVGPSSHTNKKHSVTEREKFRPKSVLKTANENSNDQPSPVVIAGPVDKSRLRMGALRPGRSVSFQDGRKNGKIIGLVDEDIAEEESEFNKRHEDVIEEQCKPLEESNVNHHSNSRKHQKIKATVEEAKVNKQNMSYRSISHSHQTSPAMGAEHSFNQDENSQSLLNQTSLILMNSTKRKVRRKASSSSTTGTPNSTHNSFPPTPTPNHSPSSHVPSLLSTTTSKSNHINSHNMISEYSFELNYSKLIKIITDFEPFEPFWNAIKVICLANKSIDSVIRLDEILPLLDQIDLSSNQLNYLTGLPSGLRMLIVSRNQIDELCSFSHLQDLVRLDLSENSLSTLQQLSCLKHLRELKADGNLVTNLVGIDQLDGLVKLSLKGNRIKKINFESTHWNHMEVLNLDHNQISEINGLHLLKSVYLLNLDRNQIHSLIISHPLPDLRVLRINENRLESLDVSKLINLRTLYIDNNDLMEISGASQLKKLENLSVRDQRGGELSLPLKQVRDVKRIYLGGNPLPAAFPTSQFYNLTYLELAMCQCQSLPMDLANLIPNIRTLNLNYNFLKDLSPLKNLKRLERLTVVGSRIKSLDKNLLGVLESLPELELLDFRQNPLCTSFYPPLLLKSTPSASLVDSSTGGKSSAAAPHLDQYQIVTKEQEDHWPSMDDRFRKSLPNEFYLKRMTYRSIVTRTCSTHASCANKFKCLDGITINEVERRKMDKFLRGLSRKLHQQADHHPSSSSNTHSEATDKRGQAPPGRPDEPHTRLARTHPSTHHSPLPHHPPSSSTHPLPVIINNNINNNINSEAGLDPQLSSNSLLQKSLHLAIIDRSRY